MTMTISLYRDGSFWGLYGAEFDASGVARIDAHSRACLAAMPGAPAPETLERALFRASEALPRHSEGHVTRRAGEWTMDVRWPG